MYFGGKKAEPCIPPKVSKVLKFLAISEEIFAKAKREHPFPLKKNQQTH
jgi:hypothetical protein